MLIIPDAFGRYVAEATFWTPAPLLPRSGVAWEAVVENTARVAVRYKEIEQSVDINVSSTGQLTQVNFSRWSV
jgi:Ni,Fe-hydrogenase III large subunit